MSLTITHEEIIQTLRILSGEFELKQPFSFSLLDAGTTAGMNEVYLNLVKATPKDGGDRRSWPDELKTAGIPDTEYKDVFSRMYWERPAPTITGKFMYVSCGRFVHPEENRGLSFREGATLQGFPKNYRFRGKGIAANAVQVGNAVPPVLAKEIGAQLIRSYNEQ